jgi:hypothetical protein
MFNCYQFDDLVMKKIPVLGMIAAAVLVAGIMFAGGLSPQSTMAAISRESVSVTVVLDDVTVKPGEVVVLLDTTASGTLNVVHVAANLPCTGPRDNNPGNDTPNVTIVAGVAGGPVGGVIDATTDDTSFVGPKKTCVFHDTFSPSATVPSITDVILINLGANPVHLPTGTTVTITGTYV